MLHDNGKQNANHSQGVTVKVRVGSIRELVGQIKDQVDYDCFPKEDKPQVEEICLTVAEVYRLPPDAPVQVAGEKILAATVQEVYGMLTHEHVADVIANMANIGYEIRSIKTYRRTALYNAVFELEGRITNQVNKILKA